MAERLDKEVADKLREQRDTFVAKALKWAKENAGWLIVSGVGYGLFLATLVAYSLKQ